MVQGTANDLTAVQRKTVAEQKEIHELQADWTFLNQPELLGDLNKRYVGLVPVAPKRVGALIDNIPMRPTPPPQPEPAPQPAATVAPDSAQQTAQETAPNAIPLEAEAASTALAPLPIVHVAAGALAVEPPASVKTAEPTSVASPSPVFRSATVPPMPPVAPVSRPAVRAAAAPVPVPAPAPIVRAVATPPVAAPSPSSLNALFAQVAGGR